MTPNEEIWLNLPYAEREAIAEHIFRCIVDRPGSFRKLIYDKLKFDSRSYGYLYRAGGMEISNLIGVCNKCVCVKNTLDDDIKH